MSVSRDEFVKAFQFAWKRLQDNRGDQELLNAYDDDARWTDVVLGADVGLVCMALDRLNSAKAKTERLEFSKGWLFVDALYVSNDTIWGTEPQKHFYPTKLSVLIENENRKHWDTELWKLAHIKADLKVLIGYDFGSQNFTHWIRHGGKECKSALEKINGIDPCDVDKFLLIVGSRDASGRPGFRYLSPDGEEIQLRATGS